MNWLGSTFALLVAAGTALAHPAAGAQADRQPGALADPDSTTAADTDGEVRDRVPTAPPVVVTAGRREQGFRDVPMAVSVLAGSDLRDAGIDEFEEIERRVPSLELERTVSPFLTSMRIRGIGNLANIPNFEPSAGLFVDGAYRSRSGIAVGDLIDVERIEVLRGPQGVLYPKNVTAGLVSVVSRPPAAAFEAYAGATLGKREFRQVRAGASGPLADGVRARLGVAAGDRDGDIEDIVNGSANGAYERLGTRGAIEAELGERANLRVSAGASRKAGYCCAPEVRPGPTSLAFLAALGRPVDADPFNRRTAYSDIYTVDIDQADVIAELDYAWDAVELTATGSFDGYDYMSRQDIEQSALTVGTLVDRREASTFSQEVRLASVATGPWRWLAGAYALGSDAARGSPSPDEPVVVLGPDIGPLPLPGAPGDEASFHSENDTRHVSVFGELERQVGERTRVSVGLRCIAEEQRIDVRSELRAAALPTLAATFTVPAPVAAERDTDGVAWNASAIFDAAPNVSLYATVARGFKGGGYNGDWDAAGLSPAQREFGDERVLSLDAGIKGLFHGGRIALNASVFHETFDDFQNASFLGLNFLVRNAEEVRSRGIEIDGTLRPAPAFVLDYALTLLDADYRRFTRGPCYFGQALDDPVDRTCDASGQELPNAPRWRAALGARWERALGTGTGFVRVDWAFASDHLPDAGLDPRTRQAAYQLWNARVGWRGERASVSLWGENLFDETVIVAAGRQTLFGGVDGGLQYFLNDARAWGIALEWRY